MVVRLYHGGNAEVRVPEILVPNRSLDFGPGFYATSSCDQAQRWAELQTGRRKTGVPTVNVYDFDLEKAENPAVRRLSALRFIEVKNYDKTHASFNSTEF